jgi:hypothetical protein
MVGKLSAKNSQLPTVTLKILNRSGLVAESAAGHGLTTFLLERGS